MTAGRDCSGEAGATLLDHRIEFVDFRTVVIKTLGHDEWRSSCPRFAPVSWALTWAISQEKQKSGTGEPLHTKEPVTVASFRTWRGWRENVARNRCLTLYLIKRSPKTEKDATPRRCFSTYHQSSPMAESECAVYKELKDRETRAHAAWTSYLFRNESQAEALRESKQEASERKNGSLRTGSQGAPVSREDMLHL